jgi:hypothetical protein
VHRKLRRPRAHKAVGAAALNAAEAVGAEELQVAAVAAAVAEVAAEQQPLRNRHLDGLMEESC